MRVTAPGFTMNQEVKRVISALMCLPYLITVLLGAGQCRSCLRGLSMPYSTGSAAVVVHR